MSQTRVCNAGRELRRLWRLWIVCWNLLEDGDDELDTAAIFFGTYDKLLRMGIRFDETFTARINELRQQCRRVNDHDLGEFS